MKKMICLLFMTTLMLTGCVSEDEANKQLIEKQKVEIVELEERLIELKNQEAELQKNITDIKIENGLAKYVLTLNISQSHFTFDLSEHLKDSMNDIEIQIPVDKEFYDSVDEGDLLEDSFRMGSFLMKGSFGNWEVKIVEKEII